MNWRDGIKEIRIDGEWVCLKKSKLFGWSVVHPAQDEKGNPIWKNILAGGSWLKLILVIMFVIISIGAMLEVSNIVQVANECLNNNQILNILK